MAAPSQLVGHALGHDRIIEQIGAGGMGFLYRAHDEHLERDVAIKVLPVGTLTDEAARKRFRKEAFSTRQAEPSQYSHDFRIQHSEQHRLFGYGVHRRPNTG